MNWRHFGFSTFFRFFIFAVTLQAFVITRAEIADVTSQDIVGSSQSCQIARKEIPAPTTPDYTCKVQNAGEKLGRSMSDAQLSLTGSKESKTATLEIKRRLLQNAVDGFATSVARSKQLTGIDPLVDKFYENQKLEMLKKCGEGAPALKAEAEKLMTSANSKTFSPAKDNADLNRYMLAMIEFSRIDKLIKDNYARGEDKEKLIERRKKILIYYPMAQRGAPLHLKTDLEMDLKISVNDPTFKGSGPDWLDDYLFKSKDVPADAKPGGSSTHALAMKLKNNTPISERVRKDVASAFSTQLLHQMKSVGELCKADPCTTFNISHELTAQILRRRQLAENIYQRNLTDSEKVHPERMKFSALQKEVCNCKLLAPTKLISDEALLGMSVGTIGGLVICVFVDPTKLSCPLVAAAALTTTAAGTANTVLAAKDAVQINAAVKASENLPSLASAEKNKLTTFQKDRITDVGTDVAVAVGGNVAFKVAAPYAKAGIAKVKNKFGKKSAETGAEAVEHRGKGELEDHATTRRNQNRSKYTDEYAEAAATTPQERESFNAVLAAIEAAKATGKPIKVVVKTVENSIQKLLNTITNDFALVNAINNRRDLIIRGKLKAYLEKHPSLKLEFSSDWKGLHTIAHGDIPKNFDADFSRIVSDSYHELATDLVGKGIMRAGDKDMLMDSMNHSGYGKDFDQAGAARKMDRETTPDRSKFEGRGGTDFNNPNTLENHRVRFQYTEQYRSEIEKAIGNHPELMALDPVSGKKTPTRDLFLALKVSDDPAVIRETIKYRHGIDVDEITIRKLKEYKVLVSEQSPNLVPKVHRENASLYDADNGGVSSDTIAMGSFNDGATGVGLARATENIQSLESVRQGEQTVTKWLNESVNPQYRNIAAKTVSPEKVAISGDEKKIAMQKIPLMDRVKAAITFKEPPSEKKLKDFVRAHAADDPSLQRHTYIRPGVPKAMRDPMTEHGHTVQKYLWEILEQNRVMPYEKLKNMNGLMMMESKTINKGDISIIVGQKPGSLKMTDQEMRGFQKALDEALAKFNKATSEKAVTTYKRGRIILANE